MNRTAITHELKLLAQAQGFRAAGVAPAMTPTGVHRFYDWLAAGYAGEMSYLVDRADAYRHPDQVMPGARSLLMMALDYRTRAPQPSRPGQGRVSCYAWGSQDYHDLVHAKLKRLRKEVERLIPGVRVRGVIDTAPLLEREFAQLAGLGWQGKNTMLICPTAGSYFFLAALLLDVELTYDAPFPTDHCGACTACLDACPTGAFPEPYVLDATRCISYLTIELKSMVPLAQRSQLGDWLLGCDICQEVCPWNRFAPQSLEPALQPREDLDGVQLSKLFYLDDDVFRATFRRTPLWRPKRRGILRNAALILAGHPDSDSAQALEHGTRDPDPLVRDASQWALDQLNS